MLVPGVQQAACPRLPPPSQARAAEDFGDEAGEEGADGLDAEAAAEKEAAAERKGLVDDAPWAGTDREYTYEELLGACLGAQAAGSKRVGGQAGK